MEQNKKTIITGIQPSGVITLGNYIGAIKQMKKLQDECNSLLFIADMHAITVPQDPKKLHNNIRSLLALYIACGIDPEKNTIFLQSENPYHANVSWMLECVTPYGELSRMTQFKDKSSKNQNFSAGLLTYPILMAADILIYDVDYVPVGIDQKQHVELARNIAQKFNKKFGDTFKVPEPMISKSGTKIMDLQDPMKKMSKSSDNPKATIRILDSKEEVTKKIMSAVTDNDCLVKFDMDNKPGISNLMNIVISLTDETISSLEEKFAGKNYGEFKKYVAEVVTDELTTIQSRYYELLNSNELDDILNEGAKKVRTIAEAKYNDMKNKMGLYK